MATQPANQKTSEPSVWQQLMLASIPAFFSLATGMVVFYGEFRAMSERLEAIGDRSTRYHHNVREAINDHADEAAHGTVREDLATLGLRATALEHRASLLERHAGEGERYTEKDAERDGEHYLVLIQEIREDASIFHREVRNDVRALESRLRSIELMFKDHQHKESKQATTELLSKGSRVIQAIMKYYPIGG